MSPDIFKDICPDVSRETVDKLIIYERLMLKWQRVINLVSEATLEDRVMRHFIDSSQVLKYLPDKNITLADMGSGAGFPGMVLAILGVKDVHLIESDIRKATFLREVSRETSTPVTVQDRRVEDVSIPNIDIITARALAPLRDLLSHASKLATPRHPFTCLFLKGEKYQEEIDFAKKKWNFDLEVFQSDTDSSGKILKIKNLIKYN